MVLLLATTVSHAQSAAPPEAENHTEKATYHLVELDLVTTSDWTVVQIGADGSILTSRFDGPPSPAFSCSASAGRLEIHQSLERAKAGAVVRCTARLALDAAAAGPLKVVIEKGAIGETTVRFRPGDIPTALSPGMLRSAGTVAGDTDRNRREFTVDLSLLKGREPRRAEVGRAAVPKMVWAFYYPWYSLRSWESPELNDRPAAPYASDDPRAIGRHIDQAKAAGIDGFICSWWGPGHATDKALPSILAAAAEKDFKITIYFETLNEKGGRPEKEVLNWLRSFLKTYADAPALMHVDGTPLVVLWASGSEPRETWRRIFDTLRNEGPGARSIGMGYDPSLLDLFDGLHEYGVFTIPDLASRQREMGRATRLFGLLDDQPSRPRLWCATVQPGYDERPIPGRRGLFKDRDAGAFYRSTWDAALSSDPDWVFITTWNEWWEHTHIEPGEKEGDLYLRITREYAEKWKAGR